jgi:hypothetical protein
MYDYDKQVDYRPDDGGSKRLWNVGKLLPIFLATAKCNPLTPNLVSIILKNSAPTAYKTQYFSNTKNSFSAV